MRRFFILGAVFVFSMAMLMTACKKDEVKNNGNNNGDSDGGGGTAAGYVDLGLPSGTKWKSVNETGGYNGFYTYEEAVSAFGDKLPTKEQLEELKVYCAWEWQNNGGYKVTGTNGNSIVLPAAGYRDCDGNLGGVGSYSHYWSSTSYNSDCAWFLGIHSGGVDVDWLDRCHGYPVRLVQD